MSPEKIHNAADVFVPPKRSFSRRSKIVALAGSLAALSFVLDSAANNHEEHLSKNKMVTPVAQVSNGPIRLNISPQQDALCDYRVATKHLVTKERLPQKRAENFGEDVTAGEYVNPHQNQIIIDDLRQRIADGEHIEKIVFKGWASDIDDQAAGGLGKTSPKNERLATVRAIDAKYQLQRELENNPDLNLKISVVNTSKSFEDILTTKEANILQNTASKVGYLSSKDMIHDWYHDKKSVPSAAHKILIRDIDKNQRVDMIVYSTQKIAVPTAGKLKVSSGDNYTSGSGSGANSSGASGETPNSAGKDAESDQAARLKETLSRLRSNDESMKFIGLVALSALAVAAIAVLKNRNQKSTNLLAEPSMPEVYAVPIKTEEQLELDALLAREHAYADPEMTQSRFDSIVKRTEQFIRPYNKQDVPFIIPFLTYQERNFIGPVVSDRPIEEMTRSEISRHYKNQSADWYSGSSFADFGMSKVVELVSPKPTNQPRRKNGQFGQYSPEALAKMPVKNQLRLLLNRRKKLLSLRKPTPETNGEIVQLNKHIDKLRRSLPPKKPQITKPLFVQN